MTFDRYAFITFQDLLDLITIYASMPQSSQEPIGFTLAYEYEGFFYLGQIYQCGVVSTGPKNPDCGLTPGAYVNLAMPDIINWLVKVGSASNTSRISEHSFL